MYICTYVHSYVRTTIVTIPATYCCDELHDLDKDGEGHVLWEYPSLSRKQGVHNQPQVSTGGEEHVQYISKGIHLFKAGSAEKLQGGARVAVKVWHKWYTALHCD